MNKVAIYLHPQVFSAEKPLTEINFTKFSYPYYNQVREALAYALSDYPIVPLKKANINDYLTVHSPEYFHKINLMANNQSLDAISLSLPELSTECRGMLSAIDLMKEGKLDRAYCFSMVGHHSHKNWGHGYCLLNPQAAAVKYAQSQGFRKVLIVDWDIHHGDGTQSIFADDKNTYCVSIHHAMDLYMAKISDLKAGTTEVGKSLGHCNFPRYILDLEGITDWTNFSFCRLTKIVLDLAIKSDCPILSVHGGGYNLPVTVKAAIAHIDSLTN